MIEKAKDANVPFIDKRMTKVSLSLVKISLMEALCVLGKKVL